MAIAAAVACSGLDEFDSVCCFSSARLLQPIEFAYDEKSKKAFLVTLQDVKQQLTRSQTKLQHAEAALHKVSRLRICCA